MKKQITFLATFLLVSVLVFSQEKSANVMWKGGVEGSNGTEKSFSYTFSNLTGTYANLTGATSLNNGDIWDDPDYMITLPFQFVLSGTSITSLEFTALGGALMAPTASPLVFLAVLPFDTDLIDRGYDAGTSMSPLSYKVEGTTGNRILKIEWNNAGSYDEGDPFDMYVNFQLWLYETTNVVEMRYGPNMINNPTDFYGGETGAYIGFLTWDADNGTIMNEMFLTGTPANPVPAANYESLNGTPANGTIYKFTPATSNIIDGLTINNDVTIFPNPTADMLNISNMSGKTVVAIVDFKGAEVLNKTVDSKNVSFDITHLSTGLYFVSVTNNAGRKGFKLIKE